MDAFNDDLNFK